MIRISCDPSNPEQDMFSLILIGTDWVVTNKQIVNLVNNQNEFRLVEKYAEMDSIKVEKCLIFWTASRLTWIRKM